MNDRSLVESAKDYQNVKRRIIEQFTTSEELQQVIRQVLEAQVTIKNNPRSLKDIDRLHAKAGFVGRAKFGLLRLEACKHEKIAQFISLRGQKDYLEMTEALMDFWFKRVAFLGFQHIVGSSRPPPRNLRFTTTSVPKISKISSNSKWRTYRS